MLYYALHVSFRGLSLQDVQELLSLLTLRAPLELPVAFNTANASSLYFLPPKPPSKLMFPHPPEVSTLLLPLNAAFHLSVVDTSIVGNRSTLG